MAGEKEKNAEISIWLGCTTRFYFEDTIKSLKSILKKLDIDYKIIDEEDYKYSCCASTLLGIGLYEQAEENRDKIEPVVKKIIEKRTPLISPCPGCTQVFSKKYELNSKSQHITQFLFDNLDKMKLENKIPLEVTYHDSCHLARGLDIVEEPRRILSKIPNLNLNELSHCKKETLCCGSGGGLRAANKELADTMSSLIVREAAYLGSSMIVTACPFCERSFLLGRDLVEADIEVKNLLTLVDEHLV